MTTALVTLEQAQRHLRDFYPENEEDIEMKIQAASAAVMEYLQEPTFVDSSGEVPEDSNGAPEGVPFQVQQATLLLLGDFYKNREPTAADSVPGQFGYGYLPRAVTALLYPFRYPVIGSNAA